MATKWGTSDMYRNLELRGETYRDRATDKTS